MGGLPFELPELTLNDVRSCMGGSSWELVNRALSMNHNDHCNSIRMNEAIMEQYVSLFRALATNSVLYNGVKDALHLLDDLGVKKAILSNRAKPLVLQLVGTSDLALHFPRDCVIGFSGRWPPKPSPDALNFLMKYLNEMPEQTVMIGDSDIDSQVAHATGCAHIGCLYGYGSPHNLGRFYLADSGQSLRSVLVEWHESL